MSSPLRTFGSFFVASLLLVTILLFPQPDSQAPYVSTEAQFKSLKNHLRGPVKEPSDWFMMQRVGPDGTLNMNAVHEARQ